MSLTIKMKMLDQKKEARERLLAILKPGDTVFTILRRVSSSAMSRSISLIAIVDNRPVNLDYDAECLGLAKRAKHEGLLVTGCGMDMGFHLVYGLGALLWPNGTETPHGKRNGEPDSTGGYALNHRWL